MALALGDRLGPYRIEALLGTGGMGEVYRGRDTRLGREVALKVISATLVDDPAHCRRFESAARAASVLNHPCIVTVYDVGDTDGIPWIAMEWVEGRTLRDLIDSGPLVMRDAVAIARQIAEGLAVAHARGVVHRDLKPGVGVELPVQRALLPVHRGHGPSRPVGRSKGDGQGLARAAARLHDQRVGLGQHRDA